MIAVVAVLAALVILTVPWLGRAIEQAKSTRCAANLRVIGAACMGYAADNDMSLPVTTHQRKSRLQSWTLSLQPYAHGTLAFRCPCDEVEERVYTYLINDFLTPNPAGAATLNFSRLSKLGSPSTTVLFGEASQNYQGSDHFHFAKYVGHILPFDFLENQIATERHLGAANYLFADGHVETLTSKRVREILAEPGNRFLDPTASIQLNNND
jgi:prepilin-type processing-associated H-X9-DG protein